MKTPTTLLVLGLTALVVTSPAAAEQWVLWHRNLDGVSPVDTYPTKTACQAQGRALLVEVARDRRATGDEVKVFDAGLTVVSRQDNGYLQTLTNMACWPPGVTPRPASANEATR
jgi:hypothetical protein